MKKTLKIAGFLLAALALAAIAGIIVLKKMFPPEKIKAIIVQEISQKLKREVNLGEIKIGLFKGISIGDFALSESPNFKSGTFVQSERFILKFRLLPLIHKKIIIDEVALETPRIRVIQNADGKTFNFSDLLASPKEEKQSPKEAPPSDTQAVSLTVSKARIAKGKVEFIDKSPKKIKVVLDPIDLTLTGTGLDKPMSVDFTVGVESSFQNKNIKGELKTKSIIDIKSQSVRMESFRWKMNGAVLDVKGDVKNFIEPQFNLSASIHDVEIKQFSRWISLPKELRVSGSPHMELDLKGTLQDLNATLSVNLTMTELAYSNLFQKDAKTAFSIFLNGALKKQENLSLNSLKIQIAGLETELKGEIKNISSSNPTLKIQAHTKPFDLKEISKLSAIAEPYNPSGQISLQATASGLLKLLALNGSLKLDKVGAKYEKMNIDSLSGTLNFTDQSFDVPQLAGKIGAAGTGLSEFHIQASLKNFQQPDIVLDAHFSALDLGMFMSDKKKEEVKKEEKPAAAQSAAIPAPPYKGPLIKAQGTVTIGKLLFKGFEGNQAHLSWKLSGITPNLNKINGNAEIKTADGTLNLKSSSLFKHLGNILEMANKFTGSTLLDPSAMVFQKISGTYIIQDGTAKSDDFQINSPKADIYQKGTIRLSDMDKNLLVSLKLPKGSIGGTVGQFTTDEEGRPSFSFKVTGTEKTQKVTMDTSVVQKKATEELKKKGAEVLQNEGKKLLEGLFKR